MFLVLFSFCLSKTLSNPLCELLTDNLLMKNQNNPASPESLSPSPRISHLHSPNSRTSSYPGWIKSPHVVILRILKLSDLDSENFHWEGYSRVNFGHPKSEVFRNGGGYSGVNFGHPKSEVFQNGGVFRSKLWSSQI